MSRSRSIRIVLMRASASNSAAMPSCGSICVVYGLNSRPSSSRPCARSASQSTVGIRDEVRVVVADRAVDLARERRCRESRAIARSRRATTLAISLPSVVGVAGWPCVRASIGRSGMRVRERAQVARSTVNRRQQRRRGARRDQHVACARLLMSSDVQAKWMNSADPRHLRDVRRSAPSASTRPP